MSDLHDDLHDLLVPSASGGRINRNHELHEVLVRRGYDPTEAAWAMLGSGIVSKRDMADIFERIGRSRRSIRNILFPQSKRAKRAHRHSKHWQAATDNSLFN